MASDPDFINDAHGVLKAPMARSDLHTKWEKQNTGESYNEFVAAAKSDPDLARFFECQPEISDNHPALYSLAEQAKLIRERGQENAAQFMRDNGGALGSIKPRPKVNADEIKGQDNPWAKNYRGKDAEAHRLRVIKSSTKLASQLARAAGVTLTGQPLKK